jgi:hypothetical protein
VGSGRRWEVLLRSSALREDHICLCSWPWPVVDKPVVVMKVVGTVKTWKEGEEEGYREGLTVRQSD